MKAASSVILSGNIFTDLPHLSGSAATASIIRIGGNQRFDRIESTMSEILSKIDMLTKKMAVSSEIELSLETRINRIELSLTEYPTTSRIFKTLNFDTTGMTEEARVDPEPSPISVKFKPEENKTANKIGDPKPGPISMKFESEENKTANKIGIAEHAKIAEEDDNDTIEEATI